ncbi:hypothetical protein [Pseudomonas indica]|uniref:hypothetical protein n=1 Tax=Pseudomonas indica TaxID=137658 RepID=UPI003FD3EBE9
MAYESFILSVVDERIALSKEEKLALLPVGHALGVDKESVFREDFWDVALSLLDCHD